MKYIKLIIAKTNETSFLNQYIGAASIHDIYTTPDCQLINF